MRIAKRIARSGLASRREAEAMIANGRVSINDEPLTSPARNVAEDDVITLDGRPLSAIQQTRVYLFYKPREVLTARSDPRGRHCVPDFLPPHLARLKTVGRLDFLSEGLLLLTTDGELARYFEHPDNALLRRYRLRLHGDCSNHARTRLAELAQGITVDGFRYRPITIKIQTRDNVRGNFWVEASLREGKNRELRKIMNSLGYRVSRLIRTQYGRFSLGRLEAGALVEVSDKELRRILASTSNFPSQNSLERQDRQKQRVGKNKGSQKQLEK